MADRLSVEVDTETFAHLDRRSREVGQTPTRLATTLLEEGLRMEEHPGIVFRPGPSGRRAGLAGGPDVWEVARVFQGADQLDGEIIQRAAALTGLEPTLVVTALRYYLDYKDEIDTWIRRLDAEALKAEASWRGRNFSEA